jgi:hypothetical protein
LTKTAVSTTTIEDNNNNIASLLFDRKIEAVTVGLPPEYSRLLLNKVSKDNALTIVTYIVSMKSEINYQITIGEISSKY